MAWTAIFTKTLTANTDGWGGYTLREWIDGGQFTGTASGNIRINLQASSSSALAITNAYIGLSAGGAGADNYLDFTTTPTQITFDTGNPGKSVAAGVTIQSDPIAFPIDGIADIIISIYTASTSGYRRGGGGGSATDIGFKAANEAATVNVSGYNVSGVATNVIASIEAEIIAPADSRLTQAAVLALAGTEDDARLTQAAVHVLGNSSVPSRMTQAGLMVLNHNIVPSRMTQAGLMVLGGDGDDPRLSQAALLVLARDT